MFVLLLLCHRQIRVLGMSTVSLLVLLLRAVANINLVDFGSVREGL